MQWRLYLVLSLHIPCTTESTFYSRLKPRILFSVVICKSFVYLRARVLAGRAQRIVLDINCERNTGFWNVYESFWMCWRGFGFAQPTAPGAGWTIRRSLSEVEGANSTGRFFVASALITPKNKIPKTRFPALPQYCSS